MISGLGISLSGLNAAALQLEVSANNIANAQTTSKTEGPYVPKDVIHLSQDAGGVFTSVQDSNKPSISSFAPNNPAADANGIVQLPNVDLVEEMGKLLEARASFMANLKAIDAQKLIQNALFNELV
jgi:flagellar basal-body rod protein FlgC